MEREPRWINVTIMLWVALLPPLFITQFANSDELHKPVQRDITNDNHPDFISIDCGSDRDYLDEETGIWYQTDKNFIETGTNHKVSLDDMVDLDYPYFGEQLKTLRSFPEEYRNCYTLKPKQGKHNKYLIRAFFLYGNYDNKNQTQTFQLHIGVTYVGTVSVEGSNNYQFIEVIHTPSTDIIHVCLVKTSSTIPLISILELRPINSSIYEIMSNQTPSILRYDLRVDVGFFQDPRHRRYKDDVYDWIWRFDDIFLPPLYQSIVIDPATNVDAYKLPSQVWRTAIQLPSVSTALEFDENSIFVEKQLDRKSEYYVYLHFAEIEYLKPVTIGCPLQVTGSQGQGNAWFIINATSESKAPRILNAFEIYKLITDSSPTDARDVGAIMDIKSSYNISRLNWQGDPCLPSQYMWNGLNCSSDTNPRITSLNLNSSKLTGEISTSFSYLTELESLDLSHNQLVGPVPEFLADLPKLKILNLTWNKLSGRIPKALKEKADDTTLQLSVDGNPDLCMTDSCKKKNFVMPLVASLSALIAILLISLGFWIFRRQKGKRRSLKAVDHLCFHRTWIYMTPQVFDNMGTEPLRIVTIMLWVALVPLFTTQFANSEFHQPVRRDITNDDNHPDFISIDCGSNADYLDEETGIRYQTDKDFVETGMNHMVTSNMNYAYYGRQLKTLRSFPEGERNCYVLKPKQGRKNSYLIRAFFAYGNYDNKNQTPSFDVHIGVNYWQTISNVKNFLTTEVIHTPTSDTIELCLLKTGLTIPFISTLELRPLNSSIYHIMSSSNTPQTLLGLQLRTDVGCPNEEDTYRKRYKDDVYDRAWRYDDYNDTNGWHRLNESIEIDPATSGDPYKLPSQVLSTAAESSNASEALEFDFNSLFQNLDRGFAYYVFFHFAEIEQLPKGGKRIINITLNSKTVLSNNPLVLDYLKPVTIGPLPATGNVQFSLSATSESDAPPILNAFEIYKLITGTVSPTDIRDVGAISDIKKAYQISKLSWQGDPCVPTANVWEGLICSYNTNPRITSLNLNSSKLTGEIHTSFSYLTELESLDLSHNNLVGPVPEFLAELPKLKNLNLTGNKLSGTIPKALKEKADTTLQLSVTDNPDLCVSDSCKKKSFVVPLVASLSAFVAILLMISLGFWIFRRRRVERSDTKKGESSLKSKNRSFSYTEIINITDNFKTMIGKGGFGEVYHGILQDHTQVAVKLLSPSSVQGYKEFLSEVQLLMIVHHRNLVSLIGYCNEGQTKALIYEYMPNGNLQQHLSVKSTNVLKWNERLNIAVDAAHGLDYLHNGCKPSLVHRDLKPSNILLDQHMHAKIADFGLCRAFGNDIDSHISTRPAGTPGYVDSEFQKTGNSNKKSDIYSFGIILFEMITGHPALERQSEKFIHILEWVIPMIEKGEIRNIIDSRLQQEEFNMNSACKVVEIALSCISSSAAERPDINQVLAELKECLSMEMVHRHMEREQITVGMSSVLINDSDICPSPR